MESERKQKDAAALGCTLRLRVRHTLKCSLSMQNMRGKF